MIKGTRVSLRKDNLFQKELQLSNVMTNLEVPRISLLAVRCQNTAESGIKYGWLQADIHKSQRQREYYSKNLS